MPRTWGQGGPRAVGVRNQSASAPDFSMLNRLITGSPASLAGELRRISKAIWRERNHGERRQNCFAGVLEGNPRDSGETITASLDPVDDEKLFCRHEKGNPRDSES